MITKAKDIGELLKRSPMIHFTMENKSDHRVRPVLLFGIPELGKAKQEDIVIDMPDFNYDEFIRVLGVVRFRIQGAIYEVKRKSQLRYNIWLERYTFSGLPDRMIIKPKYWMVNAPSVETRIDMPGFEFEVDYRSGIRTFLYPKQKVSLKLRVAAYTTDPCDSLIGKLIPQIK
jgi:hypothetical protein